MKKLIQKYQLLKEKLNKAIKAKIYLTSDFSVLCSIFAFFTACMKSLFTLATEICWNIVATYSPLAYSANNYIFPTSALAMTV
jgi:hypothetical protein